MDIMCQCIISYMSISKFMCVYLCVYTSKENPCAVYFGILMVNNSIYNLYVLREALVDSCSHQRVNLLFVCTYYYVCSFLYRPDIFVLFNCMQYFLLLDIYHIFEKIQFSLNFIYFSFKIYINLF